MEFFNEYALLIVVALPVAVIVVLNAILALTGESGTLMLPSLRRFPSVDAGVPAEEAHAPEEAMAEPEPEADLRKAA